MLYYYVIPTWNFFCFLEHRTNGIYITIKHVSGCNFSVISIFVSVHKYIIFRIFSRFVTKSQPCGAQIWYFRFLYVTDLIQVMLKEHQHVKAVKYVCAFGLRDKFKPASLLKELLKNSEEASKALCENSDCPIDKKVNLLSCCFIIFMAIFLSLYLLYMIPAQSHKKVG